MARKPLIGTVAANFEKHGTGGLNIDGCRVEAESGRPHLVGDYKQTANNTYAGRMNGSLQGGSKAEGTTTQGRWPANLIHDGSEEVVAGFPQTKSGSGNVSDKTRSGEDGWGMSGGSRLIGDSGSAARFFYCAKASKADRDEGNSHPTVKPTDLMAYLCRLVTPKGGIVLDPFCGSGSTGKAAVREGFDFIGIELDPEYCKIAEARVRAELSK
jgi:hypothetical protein